MPFQTAVEGKWIRDSISISYTDRVPTLEELADRSAELAVAFPDKAGFLSTQAGAKRQWMLTNSDWTLSYKYKYMLRSHVIEVVAHKKIDAASINMADLDALIKRGGEMELPIIYVGTSVEGSTTNWDGKNAAPSGTYCMAALSIQDSGDGGAVVTGTWRSYGKPYLYTLNAVST